MKHIFLVFISLFFLACSSEVRKSDRAVVVVTTFAIYDVAKHIGGDTIEVDMLIPFGKESHSFEPTPKDIVKLKEASIFFYNGAGLEPWAKRFDDGKKGVDLSRYVKLAKAHDHHHEHESAHNHEGIDPHYWLDVENMQKIVDVMLDRFSMIAPEAKEAFEERAKRYKEMLHKLDERYIKELSNNCRKKEIFVNHNAYSYLARRYGFEVDSLVGLSPEAEPSPKVIERTIKQIREENIKVIFCESFENSSVLRSVAKDTNVKVEILHPLANITADEAAQGATYESLMLDNLQKLSQALECDAI